MITLRFFTTVSFSFTLISLVVPSSLFGQEDGTQILASQPVPAVATRMTTASPSTTPSPAPEQSNSFEPTVASTVAAVAYDDSEPLPLRWTALDRLRTLKLGTSIPERSAVLGKLFAVASRESDHPKIRLQSLAIIDEFFGATETDHSSYSKSYDVLSSTSMIILESKRTDDDVQIAAVSIALKHFANASKDSRTVLLDACRKAIEFSDALPRVREFLISSLPN